MEINRNSIIYQKPKKPLDGGILIRVDSPINNDTVEDLTILVEYTDGSVYEYTRDDFKKEILGLGFTLEKFEFLQSYLFNFKELKLDTATQDIIPLKKRYDVRDKFQGV